MNKADQNQAEIVAALRAAGAGVELITSASRRAGIPDLLVGFRGRNWLLEVKRPGTGPRGGGAGVLSDDQRVWIASWKGSVAVVTSVEEALSAIGLPPTRTTPVVPEPQSTA